MIASGMKCISNSPRLASSNFMNGPYRTAVPGQCFGGSSAFSSGKIANGLAAKARLASKLGQFAVERASGTAESIVKCLLGQIAYESAMECRIGMAGLSAGRNCP